jgi:hypothetical protein
MVKRKKDDLCVFVKKKKKKFSANISKNLAEVKTIAEHSKEHVIQRQKCFLEQKNLFPNLIVAF